MESNRVGESESGSAAPLRPGDFARLLLAASEAGPRRRARDQQADLAGEALRRRVLDRLAALDPEPEGMEAALLAIARELGPPARGIATAVASEWAMTVARPESQGYLIQAAVEAGARRVGGGRGDLVP